MSTTTNATKGKKAAPAQPPAEWTTNHVSLDVRLGAHPGAGGRLWLKLDSVCYQADLVRSVLDAAASAPGAELDRVAGEHRRRFGHLPRLRDAVKAADAERERLALQVEAARKGYDEALFAGQDAGELLDQVHACEAALKRAEQIAGDQRQALDAQEREALEALKVEVRRALLDAAARAQREKEEALAALMAAVEPCLARLHAAGRRFAASEDVALGQAQALAWKQGG